MSGVNNQIYQHLGNMENKEKFTEAKIKKFENELNEIKNEFANVCMMCFQLNLTD